MTHTARFASIQESTNLEDSAWVGDYLVVTRRGKELPVWALHLLLTLVTLGLYLPFWAGQVILEYRTRQRLVYATDDQDQLLWADMSVQPLEWQLFEQNPPPKHARVLER